MNKKEKLMLLVLTVVCGALLALGMCGGCNMAVGAAAGAGEGAIRDLQTGWRYATHRAGQAEDYTRDQDQRLSR
jgi:hypothetical protein